MNDQLKSVEELSAELNELQKKYDSLKALYSKDITEQQGTEKAFRESEEKFRSITENSADAIFITDQQGKYVYTNKAVSVMLGYTPEEMKTKTFADISPPDKLDEYFELFNLILKGGKGFDEIQLLKKDGSYLSTDLNVVLLPDGLVYGSCRDITDRKQAEKKMEEIVASLRNSQEIAMMGSWELDLATKKAKWSENCFVIYGLKPYEIEPTFAYFRSRIHPDDQHIIDESFDSILLNKEPRITELRILFPDKTIRWFQNRLIPVFVDDKLVALKGINLDITDRKKAEISLAESHQFYLQIINSLEEGIIVYDRDLRYKVWNPFMVKLSEIPKSQVIGKHPIELFPFLEEAGVIENLKKTLNGEVLGAIDFPYRIPLSGKSGWTSDKNMPIRDINGEIIGVIGTVHDITERKRTEEALKNSEKILSQLNSDKDRFISILSHDLRSPFNNLLGLSQILVDDFREMGIDDIGEISESINKSAKSTFNLLEDILMWARANAGKIPFNPQKTRFKDIYLNVIEALDSIASGKNITISYSISDHLYVYADTDMLKTVLRNLLSNALKFTDNGGTVTIGAEESPEKVTISLSDTGIGITSENLEKLFNISEVLSTRGTADETGSGLGLMLCKEFVEKHGGEIWVESEPGRGSDFRFSLPKPV